MISTFHLSYKTASKAGLSQRGEGSKEKNEKKANREGLDQKETEGN